MSDTAAELNEKVRQQFEKGPYPRIALEQTPKNNYNVMFIHNIVTPYYLKYQKVIETEGKLILDAGCGSGYKALALAEANPGSKIIGIDFSEESIKLARQRLEYHGIKNAEFYAISIEELPKLGLEFDYINCDDVLYLLSDIVGGLQSMKAVLKPEGIIRANLHSRLQREQFYRSQQIFKMMGLMEATPGETEIEIVRDIFKALKDGLDMKIQIWKSDLENNEEYILANYLLQNDKGFTIPEMFSAFQEAELDFISMVNWPHWDLMDLFKEPDNLPTFLGLTLPEISIEEKLHLFELLRPVHRLLDFWCGHAGATTPVLPVDEWTLSDWEGTRVHLHPQLINPEVKADLIQSIVTPIPFEITRYLNATSKGTMWLESSIAACLLPLWNGPQPFLSLVEHWRKIRPIDPITLEPIEQQRAFEDLQVFLQSLQPLLYVLLERYV